MPFVQSRDGTRIAFDRVGQGPPLIIVDGALCHRSFGPGSKLAAALADRFTVYTYDRRGRGESGDTAPYAPEREVDDLDALIEESGGSAHVFGSSSGAVLALDAANSGSAIRRLVLYEAPFFVDDSRLPIAADFMPRLVAAIAEGRRGDAVKMFMRLVGVPTPVLYVMQITPVWGRLKAVAHTLVYDIGMVQEFERGLPLPRDRWNAVTVPTLVMDGGKSPAWMRAAMRSLAAVLPNGRYLTLAGQTHVVRASAVAPAVTKFLDDTALAPAAARGS